MEVNRQLSADNLRLREQVKVERQQMVMQFQQHLEEQEEKHKKDVSKLREQMDESKVCQAAPCCNLCTQSLVQENLCKLCQHLEQ